jgi:hypothetical protein
MNIPAIKASVIPAVKADIKQRLDIDIPDKVADLVAQRRRDHPKTDLPKIPSAQMWKGMSEPERKAVKELLAKGGLDADKVLKDHWPKGGAPPKRVMIPHHSLKYKK